MPWTLILAGFNITGTIPDGLQYFSKLLSLELDYNMFLGTLPFTWGTALPGMTRLSLQGNQLTGSIPSSYYSLFHLQRLDLGQNGLTGTIAAEILALKNLTLYVEQGFTSTMWNGLVSTYDSWSLML